MLLAVAENIECKVLSSLAYRLQLVQHNIIALLMVQMPHGRNVDLLRIHFKINRHFTLFKNLRGIDQIGDRSYLCIPHPGLISEGLNDSVRYRHELIKTVEFIFEEYPEHPVSPFLPIFDLHIVVNPHHPLLCRNRQRTKCAVLLVVAEINGNVIGLLRGKMEPRHTVINQRKGNHPEQVGEWL